MSNDQPDFSVPTLGPISKESRWEWRSTVSNDPDIEDGETPPENIPATAYYGKFFPRGCRGVIEEISIYCMRTGSGTLTLRLSPHPSLGVVKDITITPSSDWAWQSNAIEEMWNYDSLWIWISRCDADVSWAYDAEHPYDCHSSPDSGITWQYRDMRMFIRATFTGETPGDVPISGIVNNIQIPNLITEQAGLQNISVPAGGEAYWTVEGPGWLNYALWYFNNITERDFIAPRLKLDDRHLDLGNIPMSAYHDNYFGDSHEGIQFSRWDTTNNKYTMQLVRRVPFRRKCEIGASDAGGAPTTVHVWGVIEQLV